MTKWSWWLVASTLLLLVGCSNGQPPPEPIPAVSAETQNTSLNIIQDWTGRSVIITEILTHTDLPLRDSVELYNPTDSDINIGGWYLTDDSINPRQVQLSAELTVPANGYLVLTEDDWGPQFALSEYGETIFIYGADTEGNLTGYVDGGEFNAAPNGQSFGRVRTTIGTEFVLLQEPTLGTPNALPATGPIVISEIMYEGGGPTNEYIVLTNITDSDVTMNHPEETDLVWEIRGGIDYAFPPNTVLPAQSSLILSRLDPDLFRGSGINLSADVQLFGPYLGKLRNGGESIRLVRPDKPDEAIVPYVVVDKVSYGDEAPWPLLLEDGSMALRRIDLTQYGHSPENWEAVVLNR